MKNQEENTFFQKNADSKPAAAKQTPPARDSASQNRPARRPSGVRPRRPDEASMHRKPISAQDSPLQDNHEMLDSAYLQNEHESPKVERSKGRGFEIRIAGYLMIAVFAAMIIYFIYFQTYGKNAVLVNPLNNRTSNMAQTVRKGDILTSDGVVIATTQNAADGSEYRLYPFGSLFSHTIGYETKGGAGLEASQKIRLLTTHNSLISQIRHELINQKSKGDTLRITLSYRLQQFCREKLNGASGAIAVMETGTGRILAMASTPDFNASTVDEDWSFLISSDNTSGNMINRVSQGIYPPGSTFKLVTLLEYIRENPTTWQDFSYTCSGVYTDGEYVINCHEGHAHGTVDIYGALSQSCNGAFITMGKTLDPVKWQALADSFGYNQSLSLDVQYKKSRFSISTDSTDWDKIQASIGQGTTTATPLLNLMITCAVANDGVMMKPYLVDGYTSSEGNYSTVAQPESLRRLISSEESALLRDFLLRVVRDGSGYRAASSYAQVAGKTGSAQFSSIAGRYHAWFCGYAPAENPEIGVVVLIEDGGSGGEVAAPIAGQIFDYYFQLKEQDAQAAQ